MLDKGLGNLLQGVRLKEVVGAEPAQDVAARPLEASDERIGLPLVRLTYPIRQVLRVPLDDLNRAVG
jgi:hypothetical protein